MKNIETIIIDGQLVSDLTIKLYPNCPVNDLGLVVAKFITDGDEFEYIEQYSLETGKIGASVQSLINLALDCEHSAFITEINKHIEKVISMKKLESLKGESDGSVAGGHYG